MKNVKYNKILFFISLLIYFILLIWVVIFKWTNYNSVIISINNFRDLDIFTRYSECYPWFFYYDLKDLLLNISTISLNNILYCSTLTCKSQEFIPFFWLLRYHTTALLYQLLLWLRYPKENPCF